MIAAALEAQAGELTLETFTAMCEDPEEAIDWYRLYLSRLRWNQELGA